jgi:starvation-inducible DNA-binding protein
MESVANSIQLPPLDSPHEREAVTNELQLVLQDLINLSLIGKQLHWAVVGPASHSLHLFLDELVQSWRVRTLEKHQWLLRAQLGGTV